MLANIVTALDLRGQRASAGGVFSWAFARLWAVVIIDFFLWFATGIGSAMLVQAGGSVDAFMSGALLLCLAAPLIFSDVAASVEPLEPWYLVVPLAVRRSILYAYSNGNIVRALALVALQMAAVYISLLLELYLSARAVPSAAFWASAPLTTVLTPFFAALTTTVYFDCAAREREAR